MVNVTSPTLPDLEEMLPLLQRIWNSRILTNNGPLHIELELVLAEYLGVEHVALVSNGTLALVLALKALGLDEGEVITTPYSFVATSNAIKLAGLRPKFVDISSDGFNIDPEKIESAISPATRALLPVHCYGFPCDVEAIEAIANKYSLKVIYDAAHAFGVKCDCGSLLSKGSASAISFHATKVFNTFEGGAVVSNDSGMKKTVESLKNFGFDENRDISAIGLNAKMAEFNAAVGLLQIKRIDADLEAREAVSARYDSALCRVEGISYGRPQGISRPNHAYYPIRVTNEYPISRDELHDKLARLGVEARRYFFPIIPALKAYQGEVLNFANEFPNALKRSEEILCLPIYPHLETEFINMISEAIIHP